VQNKSISNLSPVPHDTGVRSGMLGVETDLRWQLFMDRLKHLGSGMVECSMEAGHEKMKVSISAI
jgi:hypothetical protein